MASAVAPSSTNGRLPFALTFASHSPDHSNLITWLSPFSSSPHAQPELFTSRPAAPISDPATYLAMADRDLAQVAAILRLPDEILLKIASNLKGASGDLHDLALTHRRFRFVVQESLVREGRVQMRKIPRYILLLWENPGLIPQIQHIELVRDRQKREGFTTGEHAERACAGFVEDLTLSMSAAQRRAELRNAISKPSFWIMALLAIMSHTTSLTIRSDNGFRDMMFAILLEHYCRTSTGSLTKELMRIAFERLESISIPRDVRCPYPLTLAHCQALRVLTIAGSFLSGSHHLPSKDLFPQGLELIQIPCGRGTFPWQFLGHLRLAILNKNHQNLQNIQLLVDEPCRSFAYHIATGYNAPSYTSLARILTDVQA